MKKLNLVFINLLSIMLISFLLTSCEKDFVKDKADDSTELSINNSKLLSYLTDDLNLDPAKISENDQAFFYDNCMVYPKERLENYLNTIKSRKHTKLGHLLESGTYYVEFGPYVPTNWENEMKNAMNEWNNLNGHIKFSVSSNGTVGSVLVSYNDFSNDKYGPDNDSNYANCYPPSIAYYGYTGNININNKYSPSDFTNSVKKNIMAHELGHFVGFGHTNDNKKTFLYTDNSTCNWHNNYDTQSVMYQYAGGNNWNGFTTCDIAAYEALYERVFIKSNNNKYLSSENGGTWAIANRTSLGAWEKFKLKKNSDGSYSIFGSNSRYADINRGAGHYVKFNSTNRYCSDCKFWVNNISGDTYSIQSVATGKFLSSNGGSSAVRCNKSSVGSNERWQIFNLTNCTPQICN